MDFEDEQMDFEDEHRNGAGAGENTFTFPLLENFWGKSFN